MNLRPKLTITISDQDSAFILRLVGPDRAVVATRRAPTAIVAMIITRSWIQAGHRPASPGAVADLAREADEEAEALRDRIMTWPLDRLADLPRGPIRSPRRTLVPAGD
jgi:hypothetical protein